MNYNRFKQKLHKVKVLCSNTCPCVCIYLITRPIMLWYVLIIGSRERIYQLLLLCRMQWRATFRLDAIVYWSQLEKRQIVRKRLLWIVSRVFIWFEETFSQIFFPLYTGFEIFFRHKLETNYTINSSIVAVIIYVGFSFSVIQLNFFPNQLTAFLQIYKHCCHYV